MGVFACSHENNDLTERQYKSGKNKKSVIAGANF